MIFMSAATVRLMRLKWPAKMKSMTKAMICQRTQVGLLAESSGTRADCRGRRRLIDQPDRKARVRIATLVRPVVPGRRRPAAIAEYHPRPVRLQDAQSKVVSGW